MKQIPIQILATLLSVSLASPTFAQSPAFTGFTAGNLVLSRSVYAGTASTLAVGQALPPICPSTAACGTVTASDSGAYPNVFNNDKLDGSFGITSPIYLDQITPTGTLVNTLPIPTSMVSTSFSSKSELALNLSADGTALTFMGYEAPVNTIDVSNSNTPLVYDPTNPVGSSYYRAVVQVGQNGAVQVTPTNAYSGNNGRAAILANGQYYMVGNSNNGTGTPMNIVTSTGAEIATPGQPATTVPQQIGNFSIAQVNDPSTGKPYAADKAGKDTNFRGLTIFNNTMYITKGSGGNGINTVYQVGAAGTLPTLATAANAPITVLPGFPTTLAKNAGAANPFGVWFANATTLYVADEGDGTTANASSSKIAGLQKWTLVKGTWQLAYVLQNGLYLGVQYPIAGLPLPLSPATDGLRNITGKLNGDGTVTIYGLTSTISASGDQGSDPNRLVAITDNLANTTAAGAANEQFTFLRTAAAGEVLRGIALAPSGATAPAANGVTVNSAATNGITAVAPGSIATVTGAKLAVGAPVTASGTLLSTLGGSSVGLVDSSGKSFSMPLLYVSPSQINFILPAGIAGGVAQVTVTAGDSSQSKGSVVIAPVAPGIFTLNNAGLAAATALLVSNGVQTPQNVYTTNAAGTVIASPINLGAASDQAYLTLYGTGIAGATAGSVSVTVGGKTAQVLYAGPQGGFQGLDQINIAIPASLKGSGNVNVQVTAGTIAANPVQVTIQ